MIWRQKRTVSVGLHRTGPAHTLLLTVLLVLPSARGAERTVQVGNQNRYVPVAFTSVSVGNVEVECGLVRSMASPPSVTPFEASDDWLRDMSISISNRTDKTIDFLQLVLFFPETGDGKRTPITAPNISLGRYPQNATLLGNGQPFVQPQTARPLSLAPGQTMTVSLRDHIDYIRRNIERKMQFSAVTKIEIQLSAVIFEDGMRWAGGGFSVPDKSKPGQWTPLEPRYFPGTPIWPPK